MCVTLRREVSMEELLDQGSDLELGTPEIVESVTLPAGRAGDVFWSHRVRCARTESFLKSLARGAACAVRIYMGLSSMPLQQAAAATACPQQDQCT